MTAAIAPSRLARYCAAVACPAAPLVVLVMVAALPGAGHPQPGVAGAHLGQELEDEAALASGAGAGARQDG